MDKRLAYYVYRYWAFEALADNDDSVLISCPFEQGNKASKDTAWAKFNQEIKEKNIYLSYIPVG